MAQKLWDEISGHFRTEGWQPPSLPPGLPIAEIRERMAARALPIAHMRDDSSENDIRLAITLRPGAAPQAVQAQLARLDALGTDLAAQFPAPLADILRSWVATDQHEDIAASLDRFEAAVQADRLDQQTCREGHSNLNRRNVVAMKRARFIATIGVSPLIAPSARYDQRPCTAAPSAFRTCSSSWSCATRTTGSTGMARSTRSGPMTAPRSPRSRGGMPGSSAISDAVS